jgi:hypothetical protein
MKYFPKNDGKWVPRVVFVTFEKVEASIPPIKERPKNAAANHKIELVVPEDEGRVPVTEISYRCTCNKMYYDNENYPVARD